MEMPACNCHVLVELERWQQQPCMARPHPQLAKGGSRIDNHVPRRALVHQAHAQRRRVAAAPKERHWSKHQGLVPGRGWSTALVWSPKTRQQQVQGCWRQASV